MAGLENQPEEFFLALDKLASREDTPWNRFGKYLDDYEEAQRLAQQLVETTKIIKINELTESVVSGILSKAKELGVSTKGMEESIAEGTLKKDYPYITDFVNDVEDAFRESGGKIDRSEPKPSDK